MSVVKAKNGKWHREVFWILHSHGAVMVNGVLQTGAIRLGGVACRTRINVVERYDSELPPTLPSNKVLWCDRCFGKLTNDQKLLMTMMKAVSNEV